MRYLVFVSAGVLLPLMLYGFTVASGSGDISDPEEKIIFIDTEEADEELRVEIERLQTLAGIREVLEVHYPTATIQEKRELAQAIQDACLLYDLKVELVLAVIKTESAFNETAVSHKGAMGLMQVLPSTGLALARELSLEEARRSILFDIRTNVMLGCYYLKKMLDRYEHLDHALLAYNTGPTRFDMLLTSNSKLTYSYSKQVRKNMDEISKNYFIEDDSVS